MPQFKYPLAYSKGKVDGKYPIMRIEPVPDSKPLAFFVYFRVKSVYVGYAVSLYTGMMRIVEAKISANQSIKSFEDDYVMIPRRNKVGRRGKPIKCQHQTIARVPEDYSKEKYSYDEQIARLGKNSHMRQKLIDSDVKIAEYVQNLAARIKIEHERDGLDGTDTRLTERELSRIKSVDRSNEYDGKTVTVV